MAYDFRELRVLVVEDNLPMLELTRSLLLTFGVGHVFTARSGEEGFTVMCSNNPDIVIADWMMRPMNGLELTQMIRRDPRSPNPFIPIILLTGFSEVNLVMEARDSGVTEFLVKPYNSRDLYRRLVQVIERPRQFVRSGNFFGPDRRRKGDEEYTGPERRKRKQVVLDSDSLKISDETKKK